MKEKERKKTRKTLIMGIITIIVLVGIITVIVVVENKKEENKLKSYYNMTNNNRSHRVVVPNANMMMDYKPIIYLYPTEETELSVKLGYPEKITCSYPQYTKGWNVLAKPNGDLIDLDTNKELYSLYYESESTYNFGVEKEGFVVKGEDTANFLEEKLETLGLTPREAEEFIVYWLPKLQENKYNYIRFATSEKIEKNMPLEFSKQPDTLIRVLMTYKPLDKEIEVIEQKLETPQRNGFVAVEWGGTEIE